jgi:hypothetical protein
VKVTNNSPNGLAQNSEARKTCQEVILRPRIEPVSDTQKQAWNLFWRLVLGRLAEKPKVEKVTD